MFQLLKNNFLKISVLLLMLISVAFYLKNYPIDSRLDSSYSAKLKLFYDSIKEEKFYSQNAEDGVVQSLLKLLNLPLNNGKYVEIGTGDGTECNTRYLKEKFGWSGLLLDGYHPTDLNLNRHKEKISYSNILQIFAKHNVNQEFDLFSEDTDYADYWIVQEVLSKYKPKLVIVEVNQQPPELCVTTKKPEPEQIIYWDGSNYHGGSVCAFYCLAKKMDYTMVYCEKKGINCFLVRNDIFEKAINVNIPIAQKVFTPQMLYHDAKLNYPPTKNEWHHVKC